MVIKVEWLWSPTHFFVICFCRLDRAQRSIGLLSFWTDWPIEHRINLISHNFGTIRTKDCARSGTTAKLFSLWCLPTFITSLTNYALTRHATTGRLDRGHIKLRLQIFSSHDMQVCLNRHQILSKGMQIFIKWRFATIFNINIFQHFFDGSEEYVSFS